MGAMENAGCVTFRDEYLPRSRQDRAFYEFRAEVILHEMAHMWFGDLVTMRWWDDLWLNESFAEWACYHAAVEATEFTEAWTGFTNARKNWAYRQDQLPSHPPDRRRQLRPAGRRGQLRRHHLRQGRLGAQAAGRLGRPGELPRGHPGLLPGLRLRQLRVQGPADGAGEVQRPRAGVLGPGVAPDLGRQHAASRGSSWTATAPSRRSPSCRPRTPTTRRCAGTGSASASTTRSTAGSSGVRRWRSTSRVSCPRSRSSSAQQQPDLLLLNEGDLAYAKIRLDERSLETAHHEHRDDRRLAGPGAVLGRGLGHDPRRGDVGDRLRDPGPLGHRLRDRRLRRQPDPGVRRDGGHPLLRAGQPRRAPRPLGVRPAPAADDRRGRR